MRVGLALAPPSASSSSRRQEPLGQASSGGVVMPGVVSSTPDAVNRQHAQTPATEASAPHQASRAPAPSIRWGPQASSAPSASSGEHAGDVESSHAGDVDSSHAGDVDSSEQSDGERLLLSLPQPGRAAEAESQQGKSASWHGPRGLPASVLPPVQSQHADSVDPCVPARVSMQTSKDVAPGSEVRHGCHLATWHLCLHLESAARE